MSTLTDDVPELTPVIVEQLEKVRRSGLANMMSVAEVQVAANSLGCYGLVVFCSDVMDVASVYKRAETWTAALKQIGRKEHP